MFVYLKEKLVLRIIWNKQDMRRRVIPGGIEGRVTASTATALNTEDYDNLSSPIAQLVRALH